MGWVVVGTSDGHRIVDGDVHGKEPFFQRATATPRSPVKGKKVFWLWVFSSTPNDYDGDL
jgi:hypothetical protein